MAASSQRLPCTPVAMSGFASATLSLGLARFSESYFVAEFAPSRLNVARMAFRRQDEPDWAGSRRGVHQPAVAALEMMRKKFFARIMQMRFPDSSALDPVTANTPSSLRCGRPNRFSNWKKIPFFFFFFLENHSGGRSLEAGKGGMHAALSLSP